MTEHANTLAENSDDELFWDATYAIALALIERYPHVDIEGIGLYELAKMVESLPGFCDDPSMSNNRILLDIQTIWYEEATNR